MEKVPQRSKNTNSPGYSVLTFGVLGRFYSNPCETICAQIKKFNRCSYSAFVNGILPIFTILINAIWDRWPNFRCQPRNGFA